jgi:hypothetical protein
MRRHSRALRVVGFQLQQREVLSHRRRLSTIATLPITRTDFRVSLKPYAHPTFMFGKTVHRNLRAAMADHKNKWESAGLMDGYYVVEVTAIPIAHLSKRDARNTKGTRGTPQ